MIELLQTQEQPVVLAEAIRGVLRRAAVVRAIPKSHDGGKKTPSEGKKRKMGSDLEGDAAEAVLKVPPEGQALASLSAALRVHSTGKPTEVLLCYFHSLSRCSLGCTGKREGAKVEKSMWSRTTQTSCCGIGCMGSSACTSGFDL